MQPVNSAPIRRRSLVEEDSTHVIVGRHGSYRAAWLGNWPGRSLGTKVRFRRASDPAGRNASEAWAGLESEVVDADPPVNRGRPYEWGRNRQAPVRSTGVLSTACGKSGLRKFGRPGAGGGRTSSIISKDGGRSGSRRGSGYRRCRVMPAEGRTLTSGVLVKEETERWLTMSLPHRVLLWPFDPAVSQCEARNPQCRRPAPCRGDHSRGCCGETSRKAGCSKWTRPVWWAGRGNGSVPFGSETAPFLDSTAGPDAHEVSYITSGVKAELDMAVANSYTPGAARPLAILRDCEARPTPTGSFSAPSCWFPIPHALAQKPPPAVVLLRK